MTPNARINRLVQLKSASPNAEAQMTYLDILFSDAAKYASTQDTTNDLAELLDACIEELAWGRLHRTTTGQITIPAKEPE